LTSFMAVLGVADPVETGFEAVLGAVPFLGSGSSNSSADKHPNLSNKPDRPDRFFFFGVDRLAGRVVVDLGAGVGLDDDAAGVVFDISFVIAFFSPSILSPTALLAVLSSTVVVLVPSTAASSPALSSLTSAGMGRDWDTEFEGCIGVFGVAGVTTNSGGP